MDDDPLNRKLAVVLLRDAGFCVEACASAEEALLLARSEPPAAIVSDARMTGMDGFQLCEAIRRDGRLAKTPFVLVSAAVEEPDETLGRAVGADAVLARTPDLREAIAALSNLMSR